MDFLLRHDLSEKKYDTKLPSVTFSYLRAASLENQLLLVAQPKHLTRLLGPFFPDVAC